MSNVIFVVITFSNERKMARHNINELKRNIDEVTNFAKQTRTISIINFVLSFSILIFLLTGVL